MRKRKFGWERRNEMLCGVVSCCIQVGRCAELDSNVTGDVLTFLFNVMYALNEIAICREVFR